MKKSGPPKAPESLSPEASRWWARVVVEYDIGDPAGELLLEEALRAFDRMREAQAMIARDGAVVKDRFDQLKQHPATLIERDSLASMTRCLKALNLDLEPLRDAATRRGVVSK